MKSFLKENNSLPENRRVCISPCFRDGDGAAEWELRAVTEEEYRRAAENAKDKWAALCVLNGFAERRAAWKEQAKN